MFWKGVESFLSLVTISKFRLTGDPLADDFARFDNLDGVLKDETVAEGDSNLVLNNAVLDGLVEGTMFNCLANESRSSLVCVFSGAVLRGEELYLRLGCNGSMPPSIDSKYLDVILFLVGDDIVKTSSRVQSDKGLFRNFRCFIVVLKLYGRFPVGRICKYIKRLKTPATIA